MQVCCIKSFKRNGQTTSKLIVSSQSPNPPAKTKSDKQSFVKILAKEMNFLTRIETISLHEKKNL